MNAETVIVFRPIGPEELKLLEANGWRRWLARLPHQPIFYPMTNEEYARDRIEVERRGVRTVYVARFRVRRSFMDRYEIPQVGASHHAEWWIPAEDLDDLNDNIVGTIELIARFGREGTREPV